MRAQSARAIISLTLLHVTLLAGGLGPRNPLAQDGQSDAAAAARRLVVGGECWDLLYYICHYVLVGHLVVYIELILYHIAVSMAVSAWFLWTLEQGNRRKSPLRPFHQRRRPAGLAGFASKSQWSEQPVERMVRATGQSLPLSDLAPGAPAVVD